MAEVEIEVTVRITVSEDGRGYRRVEKISGGDTILAYEGWINPAQNVSILKAFEDQISEALVWARSDDVAAAADAKNEGSV